MYHITDTSQSFIACSVLLNCQHVYQWLRGFVNVIHCLTGHLEQVAMNCVEVCPCSVGLGVD